MISLPMMTWRRFFRSRNASAQSEPFVALRFTKAAADAAAAGVWAMGRGR